MLEELLDKCIKNKSFITSEIIQDIYSISTPEKLMFIYDVSIVWNCKNNYEISETYYDYVLYRHREECLEISNETQELSTLLNSYVLSRSNKSLNASNTQICDNTHNINTDLNYLILAKETSINKVNFFYKSFTIQYYVYEKDDQNKFPLLIFYNYSYTYLTNSLKEDLDALLVNPKYQHLAIGVIEVCMFNSNTIEELFIFKPGHYNILTEFEYDLQLNAINNRKLHPKDQEFIQLLNCPKTKTVFNLSESVIDVIDYLITMHNGNFSNLMDSIQNLFNKDPHKFLFRTEPISDTYALYFVLIDYICKAFELPDSGKFYLYNRFINTFITKDINVIGQNYKTKSSD